MLTRTYRLRKNSDFQRLYKTGKRFATANLVLYYLPAKLDHSQVGFVVSKKISKSAVIRNTLRRRVSAIIEENFINFTAPIQAIILIRNDFSTVKPKDLKTEVKSLLSKVMK